MVWFLHRTKYSKSLCMGERWQWKRTRKECLLITMSGIWVCAYCCLFTFPIQDKDPNMDGTLTPTQWEVIRILKEIWKGAKHQFSSKTYKERSQNQKPPFLSVSPCFSITMVTSKNYALLPKLIPFLPIKPACCTHLQVISCNQMLILYLIVILF